MSSTLVTKNWNSASNSLVNFAAFQDATLHQPNDFLKIGKITSSTTCFKNSADLIAFKKAELKQNRKPESKALKKLFGLRSEYGRYGNPTTNRVEELVSILTGTEDATLFPTRENAIISLLSGVLLREKGPHHIILGPGTSELVKEFCRTHLKENNVQVEFLNATQLKNVSKHFRPETRMVFLENQDTDFANLKQIDTVVEHCRKHKVLSVVEGNAATPRNVDSPPTLADVLIPSTYALHGSKEFKMGVVAGNLKINGRLKAERGLLGGIPTPEDSFALAKGMESFPRRSTNYQEARAASKLKLAERETWLKTTCQQELAKLEHTEVSALCPSGMSAMTTLFSALLLREKGPHHIVVCAQGYRKNREFYTHLKNAGVKITAIEPEEFAHLDKYIIDNTRFVFIESPTNPFLRVTDIKAATEICRARNVLSIVDNTFTPNMRPIDLGADFVCAFTTKYIAGHNDSIGGYIAGPRKLMNRVLKEHRLLGASASGVTAEKVLLGLETLDIRTEHQNKTAKAVADAIYKDPRVTKRLAKDPRIKKLWYPGHFSHPDFDLANRVLPDIAGGVFSIEFDFTLKEAARFIDALKLFKIAPSFGGNEPIVSQVAIISHFSQTVKQRNELNIGPGLVRFSVGMFPSEALIRDIMEAMDIVRPLKPLPRKAPIKVRTAQSRRRRAQS